MKIIKSTLLAATMLFPVTVLAQVQNYSDLPQANLTLAERYTLFCDTFPQECVWEGDDFMIVNSSSDVMTASDMIGVINTEINERIIPIQEPPGQDIWLVGSLWGDCDEYVWTKRAILRGMGLPTNAMIPIIVVATNESGDREGHMVLGIGIHDVATGEKTILILDNLTNEIVEFSDMAHEMVMLLPKMHRNIEE
jgi:predicted transglutaminase-like cysteine proteinase